MGILMCLLSSCRLWWSLEELEVQVLGLVSSSLTTGATLGTRARTIERPTPTRDWEDVWPIVEKKVSVKYRDAADPATESAYKIRSGLPPPVWATKIAAFQARGPPDERVCFVHVGKTAGSTLSCLLGFRYDCQQPTGNKSIANPGGRLPRSVTNVLHNYINDCYDDMAYYLMVVRNPLARMQSWFTYERPGIHLDPNSYMYEERKALFLDCPFPTLNDLAEQGLADDGIASKVCKDRAHAAIRGIRPMVRHNYYNFGYFMNQVPSDAKLLIIRTEHLESDWNSTERAIGGNESVTDAFPTRNSSAGKKSDADRMLSETATTLLCRELCPEIQVYKSILHRALNLEYVDVEISLNELKESCPVEVANDECRS